MRKFQSIVLRLANQEYVRCWYWLNYPATPQKFGLGIEGDESELLINELEGLGFVWNVPMGLWVIERDAEDEKEFEWMDE